MDKQKFTSWKKESEEMAKEQGHPIKIISKKWNTIKNIFAVVGIIMALLLAVQVYTAQSPITLPNNQTFSIKIIHEVALSSELAKFIDDKLNAYAPVAGWVGE